MKNASNSSNRILLGLVSASSLAATNSSTAAITVTSFTGTEADSLIDFTLRNSGVLRSVTAVTGMLGGIAGGAPGGFERGISLNDSSGLIGLTELNYYKGATINEFQNNAIAGDDNFAFYDEDSDGVFESVIQFSFTPQDGFLSGSVVAIAEDTMLDPAMPLTIADAATAIEASSVPEASTVALLAFGASGMITYRRRRREQEVA